MSSDDESAAGCALLGLGVLVWIFWDTIVAILSFVGIILIGVLFLFIFVRLVKVFTVGKGVTMRKVGKLERQAMALEGRSTRATQEMKLISAYATSCHVDIPNALVEARVEEELRAIKQQEERK